MRHQRAFLLTILLTCSALSAAETVRYFKAEHGVGATYMTLTTDGSYKVIDREHMGIFLTDEGYWKQAGAVITFSPKDPKKSSYQATENEHNGKTLLAMTSPDAAAGIVIAADDIEKELDEDANHLPDHVLFKVSAKTYQTETKQTYPFRYIRPTLNHWR
jgi:hypothetical protein